MEHLCAPPSRPSAFRSGCALSAAGLICTLWLRQRHMRNIRANSSFSAKRLLFELVTALAPAIALINFLVALLTSGATHKRGMSAARWRQCSDGYG